MLKKRLSLALVTAGLAGLCVEAAHGAVWGASSGGATLGQPLDFSAAVRWAADEVQAAECFGADVQVGDRRLLPTQYRVWVEPEGTESARVRVQTHAAVDEPAVSLTLSAACGVPRSKRYVVFADPPGTSRGSATPSNSAGATLLPPDDPVAPRERPDSTPLPSPERASVSAGMAQSVALSGGGWRAVALRGPAVSAASRATRRVAQRAQVRPVAPAASQKASRQHRLAPLRLPRLRLDVAEPLITTGGAVEQALQAVAQATAVARQAASAASSAADRIAALERTVDQLRAETQSSRSQAALLREQLAQSEAPVSTWLLGGVAVVMGGLAGWLAMRLAAARRALARGWDEGRPAARLASTASDAAERPPTVAMAFVHSHIDSIPMGAPRTRPAPAWPPPAPADGWLPSQPGAGEEPLGRQAPVPNVTSGGTPGPARRSAGDVSAAATRVSTATQAGHPTLSTATLPIPVGEEVSASRDVSIDELLDLEQQAEFFVVLGQDEAAIELLVEHLRHTGGGNPLPYLKLLEIHRRRGDRSDYERMRARFNHRFNAYAPEWEVDLQSGLSLDDYPGVLSRLQKVWGRPTDSMVELESLLLRKAQSELFDLPAYREVLFLYGVARDRLDREATKAGEVDVLLPLSEQTEFSSTSPTPLVPLGREDPVGLTSTGYRATAPVDLDLSLDSSRPASIFDALQETPTHPRVR